MTNQRLIDAQVDGIGAERVPAADIWPTASAFTNVHDRVLARARLRALRCDRAQAEKQHAAERGNAADAAARSERLRRPVTDEDQLRLLVAAVVDYAIITLDVAGRVTAWNDGARRLKGYEADEVLGRHFALFYPLDDITRGKAQAELATAREAGRFEEEGCRVRKGGELFWARVTLTAVHDADGHVRGFAKVTQDLTERERARAAAAELADVHDLVRSAEEARHNAESAERRLLALISAMSDGYFTLDDQWRFAVVNPSLARLLGNPGRDLVGASFWEAVTDSPQSKFFRFLPALLTGAPQVDFTEFHERTGRWFSVRAKGTEGQISVFLRDVTAEHGSTAHAAVPPSST